MLEQIEQSHQLQTSLATTAQQHNARLGNEATPDKLAALAQLAHSQAVLQATSDGQGGESGGQGKVTAFSEAQLQLSSLAGIVATTPRHAIFSAGNTSSISAGQDLNFTAQGNHHHAVKAGISLFTYGKISKDLAQKPNQETGIQLHAASGNVSSQSQSDATKITADKSITVASISKSITIAAPKHVLMTAMGAFLKLEGGNIMLHAPGKVEFKAGMKAFGGAQKASHSLPQLPKADKIPHWIGLHYIDAETGEGIAAQAYEIHFKDGSVTRGELDTQGKARRDDIPEDHVKKIVYLPRQPDKDKTADPLSKLVQ